MPDIVNPEKPTPDIVSPERPTPDIVKPETPDMVSPGPIAAAPRPAPEGNINELTGGAIEPATWSMEPNRDPSTRSASPSWARA